MFLSSSTFPRYTTPMYLYHQNSSEIRDAYRTKRLLVAQSVVGDYHASHVSDQSYFGLVCEKCHRDKISTTWRRSMPPPPLPLASHATIREA